MNVELAYGNDSGKKVNPRIELLEHAAQDLLNPSNSPTGIRRKLRTTLRPHYARMFEHDPGKAHFRIGQDINSAFHGAFLHLAGDILIANTLPRLKNGEFQMPDDSVLPDSYRRTYYRYPFTEPYDTFMKTGLYLWNGAENQLFNEIENNQAHQYYPLYQETVKVYENFRRRQTKYDPRPESIIDLRERVLYGGVDNIEAIMNIVIARDIASDRSISAREITKRSLGDADTFSWLTSVNRNAIANIFRYPTGYFPRKEGEAMGQEAFIEFDTVFTEQGEHVIFNHASLKNGPWPVPQACAGKFSLISYDPVARHSAKEFFTIAHDRAKQDLPIPEDGRYDLGKALVIVGINIGEQTIFAHRSN